MISNNWKNEVLVSSPSSPVGGIIPRLLGCYCLPPPPAYTHAEPSCLSARLLVVRVVVTSASLESNLSLCPPSLLRSSLLITVDRCHSVIPLPPYRVSCVLATVLFCYFRTRAAVEWWRERELPPGERLVSSPRRGKEERAGGSRHGLTRPVKTWSAAATILLQYPGISCPLPILLPLPSIRGALK